MIQVTERTIKTKKTALFERFSIVVARVGFEPTTNGL